MADDPTELRLRSVLRAELDGFAGAHPVWAATPVARAVAPTSRTGRAAQRAIPGRSVMGMAAAVASLLFAAALLLALRPDHQGGVASGLPTAVGTASDAAAPPVIAGQLLDVDRGTTGSAVVIQPGIDGASTRSWLISPTGSWREGPELPRISAPQDATVTQTWASDGRTIARLAAFGTTRYGDGNAIANREIWVTPVDAGALSRKVATIDDLIDAPASVWDPAGRLLAMPDGGYVVTKASSLLIVRPDGTLDRQVLPADRMIIAPTSDPRWFIVASVAGARTDTAHAPYRAMLWSREGRELPIAADVTGVLPSTHQVGRAWIQRDHGDWYPLDASGLVGPGLPNTVISPLPPEGTTMVGIDPTGTWALLGTPGVVGQTMLVAAGTGGAVADVQGAPTGTLAWLGDVVMFARVLRASGASDTDGGLVRLGAEGVEQIGLP